MYDTKILFQDDISERPRMASAISSLANYSAAIPAGPSDPDAKPVVKANLGTLMGVYLPCIQNIFGVILFIRMTWIVGTAGAVQGFFVVFLGCCVVSAGSLACKVTTTRHGVYGVEWSMVLVRTGPNRSFSGPKTGPHGLKRSVLEIAYKIRFFQMAVSAENS